MQTLDSLPDSDATQSDHSLAMKEEVTDEELSQMIHGNSNLGIPTPGGASDEQLAFDVGHDVEQLPVSITPDKHRTLFDRRFSIGLVGLST